MVAVNIQNFVVRENVYSKPATNKDYLQDKTIREIERNKTVETIKFKLIAKKDFVGIYPPVIAHFQTHIHMDPTTMLSLWLEQY
jgi:hypothetical protein